MLIALIRNSTEERYSSRSEPLGLLMLLNVLLRLTECHLRCLVKDRDITVSSEIPDM